MIEIKITGNTPLEALASLTAFGYRCGKDDDIAAAAIRIYDAEQDGLNGTPVRTGAERHVPSEDLPPEPYVEEPPHGIPDAPAEPVEKPAAKPPKLEDVREKGIAAVKKHGQPAVKAILESFGVSNMTALAETDRVAFLEKLAELEKGVVPDA